MAEDRSQHPVREIVLPLATVLLLAGNAWWGGVGWGKVSSQLETLIANVSGITTDVAAMKNRLAALENSQKTQDEKFRLFKMYTKGRIARLPYRATDDGE